MNALTLSRTPQEQYEMSKTEFSALIEWINDLAKTFEERGMTRAEAIDRAYDAAKATGRVRS